MLNTKPIMSLEVVLEMEEDAQIDDVANGNGEQLLHLDPTGLGMELEDDQGDQDDEEDEDGIEVGRLSHLQKGYQPVWIVGGFDLQAGHLRPALPATAIVRQISHPCGLHVWSRHQQRTSKIYNGTDNIKHHPRTLHLIWESCRGSDESCPDGESLPMTRVRAVLGPGHGHAMHMS